MSIQAIRRGLLALLAALLLVIPGPSEAAYQEKTVLGPTPADTAETHLGKGYEALKQDRYEQAASEFRAALALDPTLVLRARFPLAVALFESHKTDEARREFEAVSREAGDHPNVSYYLGRLDLEEHNFKDAVQELNKAIVKPPFPDTAYYLGFAYFKEGDLMAAEKWLKEAARLNPRDAQVPYQLGFVYRKQGREEEAKKALALSGELRQLEENDSRVKLECAQKLDQGLREEARAACEQLYDPDNAEKLTALGTIYGQHGDLQAALKPLRRAAELNPQSPQMQYNLALTYYQMNQFEKARPPLETALQRWPDLFQLNALYGAVLLKIGENLAAYRALHHARELNRDDSGTADLLYMSTLQLAEKSRTARQYSDSLGYLEEAAELRPKEPEPHLRMAQIYTATGHSEQAKAEQQKADRLNRNPGQVR